MKKVCTKCHKDKKLIKFYKNLGTHDGYLTICIKCTRKKVRKLKNKPGHIFDSQKLHSKRRGDPVPVYTKQELIDWCLRQPLYHKLHKEWVKSKYNRKLAPSCDRIDDYKPYTLDNLQLTTWGENESRSHSDTKNGINNKRNKAVVQLTKNSKFITNYHSISEATRQTGVAHANISSCCRRERKSAGGYIWKFKSEVLENA